MGDCWRVALRGGEVLVAPMVVDARGRRARGVFRRSGPVLLAIGQQFRRRTSSSWGTGIGVTDTGWCWWAEQGDALWIQIIGKPRALRPTAWVAAASAQIPALAQVLEGACPEGAPVARAAHAQLGEACTAARAQLGDVGRTVQFELDGAGGCDSLEPSFWLVGDAAMALDPLSGQGVYEAVRGARLVATAIQSVIDGGDARVAQRFVAERRERAWLHGVRAAAGFYRENGDRGSFWSETAAAYEVLLPERAAAVASAMNWLPERGPLLQRDLLRVSSGG